MAINDAVHWSADLGGGTTVALVQAGHVPIRCGSAVRAGAADPVGRWVTEEIDHEHRLLQALNCLLVETPAGRVLIETGIGERVRRQDPGDARLRRHPDRAGPRGGRVRSGLDRCRRHEPPPLRSCRRPAPGRRIAGVPAGTDRGPAGGVGDRAWRQQPARRVVRPARAPARARLGRRGLGGRRDANCCLASRWFRRAGTRPVTRRSSCVARARRRGRWPSSGTCACGHGARTRAG